MTELQVLEDRAKSLANAARDWLSDSCESRSIAVERTIEAPNAFTAASIEIAIAFAMARVTTENLLRWVADRYAPSSLAVGVLNAGNIPFVGLQDFLATVLTGHRYVGVTSRKSPYLLPAFAETVRGYDAAIDVAFTSLEKACHLADAGIATGSSATIQMVSRRFSEAGIAPERQLLRWTRFGLAVLDGSETDAELFGLARDVLLYDGRGCRSVTTIIARNDFEPDGFVDQANRFRSTFPPHRATKLGIARAIRFLRAVGEPFIEGDGFLVVGGDVALREPCVVRWITFDDDDACGRWIARHLGSVQVIVGPDPSEIDPMNRIDRAEFGSAQDPPLDWRPDGIDTMAFLCGA